ncbi:MAG: NUDIX domain-containing protein [Chloroflexi bacterium]|nr:NUDIX domain-containing protein [Chloroflexota bacterium]
MPPSNFLVSPRTLVFVSHQAKTLFIRRSPQKRLWPNRYNGLGGFVQPGETLLEAAQRELLEESGIAAPVQLRGLLSIAEKQPTHPVLVALFTAQVAQPDVIASDEGSLHWLDWRTLPEDQLVPDLPRLLTYLENQGPAEAKVVFFARYWYDQSNQLQITFNPSH